MDLTLVFELSILRMTMSFILFTSVSLFILVTFQSLPNINNQISTQGAYLKFQFSRRALIREGRLFGMGRLFKKIIFITFNFFAT